nr:hypothetical protein [uncultured Bdellovibrio sp.]
MQHKRVYILSISFLLGAVFLFALSCLHRLVHIDDAYLGEQTFWLAKEGLVRSELFRGLMNYENQLFVYHKLYIWQGALLTKLLGFNVYYLKAIALVYFAAFLGLFFLFLKQQKIERDKRLWLLGLIVINPAFFELAFVYRPDVSVAFWGLFSCFFLFREPRTWNNIILAALGAGLASATHLNGLIFASAGGLLLLWRRQWAQAVVFGIIAGILAMFYLHDAHSISDLKTLIYQLTHDPMVIHESYGIWSLPLRFIDEQRRYFHSASEIAFTLALIVCGAWSWKLLWNEKKELCLYTGALACSLALLAHGKTSKYLIYFVGLYLVLMMWAFFRSPSKWKLGSLVIYVIISAWSTHGLMWRADSVLAANQKYAALLRPQASVLAPINFIFNNIEDRRIQGFLGYEFLVDKNELPKNQESMFKRAAEFKNDYILLPKNYREYFGVTAEDHPPFKLVVQDDNFWLFERVQDVASEN